MHNKSYPKSIQLEVTPEQHRKLQQHALAVNKKMNQVLRDFIDELPEYKTKRVVVRKKK